MGDAQLDRLIGVLKQRRIWALNVGENFGVSPQVSPPSGLLPHGSVGPAAFLPASPLAGWLDGWLALWLGG